jgi:glycogen synthase
MAMDFSWRESAKKYVELYGWAVERRTGIFPN